MPPDNYYAALRAVEVDTEELEQVTLSHFGRAQQEPPDRIVYKRADDGPPALTFVYGAKDALSAIEGGPGLLPADISAVQEKIATALLAPLEQRVGQVVLFSSMPLRGYVRYRDAFQLVPVPSGWPRPEFGLGSHPLLLQHTYLGSVDPMIRIHRRMRTALELELLCVALLPAITGSLGTQIRSHWVLGIHPNRPVGASEYLQEGYSAPGLNLELDAFEPLDHVSASPVCNSREYYARQGILVGEELDVPESLIESFDAYFALCGDDRERFRRAAYWYRHSRDAFSYSRSAGFVALVSAIEALIDPSPSAVRCESCGKETGPGPTRRFVEFVERYAPGPGVSKKTREELYRLRSKLSHGTALLRGDSRGLSAGMSPLMLNEWNSLRQMHASVEVALVNWLLSQRRADE